MRDILFEGKRKDNGEWVEGCYVKQPDYNCITNELRYIHFIYKGVPVYSCLGGSEAIEVVPETVRQYTGLIDKNGKKIFEGDILLTQEFTDRPYSQKAKFKRHIGIVEYKIGAGRRFYNKKTGNYDRFENYSAGYSLNINRDKLGRYVYSNWGDFYDCEVIGNIFDNPISVEEWYQ